MQEHNNPELIADDPEVADIRELEVPRWIQVPAGIILSLLTLLCGFGSAFLVFIPNKKAPILAFVVGLALLLGCVWVLAKCFRLITGKKTKGGLMSPTALRVVSIFFLVLPLLDCSLATIAKWVSLRFTKRWRICLAFSGCVR
jgi:hypothetical protein